MSVLIFHSEFGCPSNVEWNIESSESMKVTWKKAKNASGYQVTYYDLKDPDLINQNKYHEDTFSCHVDQLLPGRTYRLSVASLYGNLESDEVIESDEVPQEGFQVTMRKLILILILYIMM